MAVKGLTEEEAEYKSVMLKYYSKETIIVDTLGSVFQYFYEYFKNFSLSYEYICRNALIFLFFNISLSNNLIEPTEKLIMT